MATIQVTLRRKKNNAGLYPISIRITKNRKSTYMYIGQYIDEKYWDSVKNNVKKIHPNSARLNNLISVKLAEINKSLLDIESDTKPIARIEEIKNTIKNKHKNCLLYTSPSP